MTEDEFAQLLVHGYELRGREFKGPGVRTDGHFFARVVRAVLGMANHRDGGVVIIGVREDGVSLDPVGLTDEQLATWKYDDVASAMAGFAEPSVSFDLETVRYKNANFIIVHVHEFEDIPILCAREYGDQQGHVLRRGGCYVRSRHKPEASEIPSQEDMRDLLDLAIDKGLRKFVARAVAAGLLAWLPAPPSPSAEEQFREQGKDLL